MLLEAFLIAAVLTLYILFHQHRRLHHQYLQAIRELQNLQDDTPTRSEAGPIDGIFEIHITIDPQGDFVKLLKYIKANEKQHSIKPVFAASTEKNNQYMISHFTRKNDEGDAIEFANRLAEEMRQKLEMKIVRIKVESHGGKGIPVNLADYDLFCDYLKQRYHGKAGRPYFEFHVKVSRHKSMQDYYDALEKDVKEWKCVAISYNLCSKNLHPLLTIRVYNRGFNMAQEIKDQVMNSLKKKGYVFEDQIQQEFSVYDSNSELDKGWLMNE